MKKLIEKLRLWLIRRLNAVPMEEHTELCREGISLLQRLERQEAEQKRLTERFRYAIREICARPHEKSGKSVKEPRLHSTRR